MDASLIRYENKPIKCIHRRRLPAAPVLFRTSGRRPERRVNQRRPARGAEIGFLLRLRNSVSVRDRLSE